jgi:hypothetical protein
MSRKLKRRAPKKRERIVNTHYHIHFDERYGGWRAYEGTRENCFLCNQKEKQKRGKR